MGWAGEATAWEANLCALCCAKLNCLSSALWHLPASLVAADELLLLPADVFLTVAGPCLTRFFAFFGARPGEAGAAGDPELCSRSEERSQSAMLVSTETGVQKNRVFWGGGMGLR